MDAITPVEGWTDERNQKLIELWPDVNVPASEIAFRIGGGLTRNAVLGRAHRLIKKGILQQRADKMPISRRPKKIPAHPVEVIGKPVKFPKGRPPESARFIPPPEPVEPDTPRIQFSELRRGVCKYPFGEHPPFEYCGKPSLGNCAWCYAHFRVVYRGRTAA